MRKSQAEAILRAASQDSSRVHLTTHAEDRMFERGVTMTQVLRVLAKGVIIESPVFDMMNGNHTCTVQGFTAGERLTLPVAIEKDKKGVIIVTVIT